MFTYLCHIYRHSPVSILIEKIFNEACLLSSMPIVCECLIAAFSSVIPRTFVTSFITWNTKADPSSEMIVVDKYACLVMVLIVIVSTVSAYSIVVG